MYDNLTEPWSSRERYQKWWIDFTADRESYQKQRQYIERRLALVPTLMQHVEQLSTSRDAPAFVEATRLWSEEPMAFFSGNLSKRACYQQFQLNHLSKYSPDKALLANLLTECISEPTSDDDAFRKILRLAEYCSSIRDHRGYPKQKYVLDLLSYFWGSVNPKIWPIFWPTSWRFSKFLLKNERHFGREDPPLDERYEILLDLVRDFSEPITDFEMVASWWWPRRPAKRQK